MNSWNYTAEAASHNHGCWDYHVSDYFVRCELTPGVLNLMEGGNKFASV